MRNCRPTGAMCAHFPRRLGACSWLEVAALVLASPLILAAGCYRKCLTMRSGLGSTIVVFGVAGTRFLSMPKRLVGRVALQNVVGRTLSAAGTCLIDKQKHLSTCV